MAPARSGVDLDEGDMTDRDHFAAAALTGLLYPEVDDEFAMPYIVGRAYLWADAMLRERAKTNHDAAPAARADAESVAPQPTAGDRAGNPPSHSGTGDTVHGASPEARARTDADRGRTDKADSRPGEGTGDTPVTKPMPKEKQAEVSDRSKPITGPTHTHAAHATQGEGSEQREGTEPVAWAVMTADGTAALHTSCTKQGSVGWKRMMERQGEVVPLYRSPTLTGAEWEAVLAMACHCDTRSGLEWVRLSATLRGLLARLA